MSVYRNGTMVTVAPQIVDRPRARGVVTDVDDDTVEVEFDHGEKLWCDRSEVWNAIDSDIRTALSSLVIGGEGLHKVFGVRVSRVGEKTWVVNGVECRGLDRTTNEIRDNELA